jgi:hypothetical protein
MSSLIFMGNYNTETFEVRDMDLRFIMGHNCSHITFPLHSII